MRLLSLGFASLSPGLLEFGPLGAMWLDGLSSGFASLSPGVLEFGPFGAICGRKLDLVFVL